MRTVLVWSDHVTDSDGNPSACYDIAFRPDGSQLIAAAGTQVLVYDVVEGCLLHSLKGHKGVVYCVAYSRDGKRFASGGADKTVIIWTYKAEGILKYGHSNPIQCLAYNPVTQQLASGTACDFGIWSPEQKSVSKKKAASKVLSAAWSADGQFLALGMHHGRISICNKSGSEQVRIERNAPVRTLQWNCIPNKTSDTLVCGCWDGTLSFYNLLGKQLGKDIHLGFNPCSVIFHDGKFLCIAGLNKQVLFCTKEGIKLTTLCQTTDTVWSLGCCPKENFIALGCNDGSISMLQIIYLTIHGLYFEQYAFRDSLTDVVVQNLILKEKVRIKCNEYITKIAVYQKQVAVQLPIGITVYELLEQNDSIESYRLFAQVKGHFDCNLLILTAEHITLCQETKLQLINFEGKKERQWVVNSAVGFVKTLYIPLSWSMRHFIDKREYDRAYQVACLGVTDADWRLLGLSSLKDQSFNVSHGCFSRLEDVCFLDFLNQVENGIIDTHDKLSFLAIINAYQGRFDEAARLYCEAGHVQRALEMFADLHMFDEAKALAEKTCDIAKESEDRVQEIIQKQAEWTEEKIDHATAADMYLIAGQPDKALALIVAHGPPSKLIEVARRLKKTDHEELSLCATLMKSHGLYAHAFETYTKMGDLRSILMLHIDLKQWEDAFALKSLHPEVDLNVFLPYGDWLVSHDQYQKALLAYKEAGHPEYARCLLEQLLNNAVREKRFKDAAFFSLQLASDANFVPDSSSSEGYSDSKHIMYARYWSEAEIYYAYAAIDQSINEPFRTSTSEMLFNIALLILGRISKYHPAGVSLVNILVCLAKHAEQLGCLKTAHSAYGRLLLLKVPSSWKDQLEVSALAIRALAAVSDISSPRLESPYCYCCSSPLPVLLTSWKDACGFCSQPVIRSFISFDQLPIVQFYLEDGISHETVKKLVQCSPCLHSTEESTILNFKQHFIVSISKPKSGCLGANEGTLQKLPTTQVIIQDAAGSEEPKYYYVIDPTLSICQCPCCNHFFEQMEWDYAFLQEGGCPFCRSAGPTPSWAVPSMQSMSVNMA